MVKGVLYNLFGEKVYSQFYVWKKYIDIRFGTYEEKELPLVLAEIAEDSTVLDIGANYGHWSVLLAKKVKLGKVYSFEPLPFTYGILEKVVKKFNLTNLEIFNLGVGRRNEDLYFKMPKLKGGAPNPGLAHSITEEEAKTVSDKFKMQVVSIDSFLPDLKALDFIKLDIEGGEYEAICGAEKLISQFRPKIFIEVSTPYLLKRGIGLDTLNLEVVKKFNYQVYKFNEAKQQFESGKIDSSGYYLLKSNS